MKNKIKTLSIVIPVYNEKNTIESIIEKVKKAKIGKLKKQIIVVDDCSTDGTREILKKIQKRDKNITVIYKEKNEGKGAAVRTAINYLKGEITVIQDADLEYDPNDFIKLLGPILDGRAEVTYGSRFLGIHRAFLFWNYVANKILNFFVNLLYNSFLTDMETCYKMMKTEILKSIKLKSKGFDFEPEITAKILKRKYKIYEVPINFFGRSYEEGKKIKAKDGFIALYKIFWYRFFD